METWGLRGTLAALVVAAAVAGLGGAAVYAATDAGSHYMGGHGPPPPPAGPGGHNGPPGPPGGQDALTVHAESVVPDGGGFATQLLQTGTITAMDVTSVTVRSADGFTQRYDLPPAASAPPFHVGDDVTIRGSRVDGRPTVTAIR